jgi:hypothetical protein
MAGRKPRTGEEIASFLCKRWRKADERYLKGAYSAARWHVELNEREEA